VKAVKKRVFRGERVIRFSKEIERLQTTNRSKKEGDAAIKKLDNKLKNTNNNKEEVESALLGKMKKLVAV
jgi:hypothetical protein